MCDRAGIAVGWAADGANRHDSVLFEPTLASAGGLCADIETLHLDRGYDSTATAQRAARRGIDDIVCAKKRPRGTAAAKTRSPLGLRRPIERTNSWLSNFGQLRRNTDRNPNRLFGNEGAVVAVGVRG